MANFNMNTGMWMVKRIISIYRACTTWDRIHQHLVNILSASFTPIAMPCGPHIFVFITRCRVRGTRGGATLTEISKILSDFFWSVAITYILLNRHQKKREMKMGDVQKRENGCEYVVAK